MARGGAISCPCAHAGACADQIRPFVRLQRAPRLRPRDQHQSLRWDIGGRAAAEPGAIGPVAIGCSGRHCPRCRIGAGWRWWWTRVRRRWWTRWWYRRRSQYGWWSRYQLEADDAADRRNGYHQRHLLTELGDIELNVPRTRRYSPVEVITSLCAPYARDRPGDRAVDPQSRRNVAVDPWPTRSAPRR